jgi:membrane protein
VTASPLRLLKETFSEWTADNATRLAAALAYYAVFSIAPLLMIAISVAGLVFGREAAQGEIFRQLHGLIGPAGAATIEDMLRNSSRPDAGLAASLIGLALLLFGASGVTSELKAAINEIWEVPAPPELSLWTTVRDRFLSLTLVLGVGFVLMVSLVVSAVIAAMGRYLNARWPGSESLLQGAELAASFAVITLMFMLIFRFVPDAKVEWRDVWLGAVVTAILFTGGKILIGLYLGKSSFASVYGAAGSLVIFLAWVYYSAQILFFGAEFTQVYARAHGSKIVPSRAAARAAGVGEKRGTSDRRGGVDRRRPVNVPSPS